MNALKYLQNRMLFSHGKGWNLNIYTIMNETIDRYYKPSKLFIKDKCNKFSLTCGIQKCGSRVIENRMVVIRGWGQHSIEMERNQSMGTKLQVDRGES